MTWPALLLGATIIYGTAAFIIVEGWSFLDAFYMTVQTLTTVGLGSPHPLDTSGQFITLTLLLLGVALVVITLTLAATAISEGGLGERRRRRRLKKQIDDLKGHFIVCAYGRVGRTVARELEAEGVPFVVIDVLEELEERMTLDGVLHLIGDPTSEPVLTDAGLERAKTLICAVDSDAANVFITLAARSLNPNIFIVARASEVASAERLYRAGADRVISPYVTSGRHMAMQAARPRVLDYFEVGKEASGLRLEEVEIDPDSDLVGRTLDAMGNAMTLVVKRTDGEVLTNPPRSFKVEAGDVLVLMGKAEDLRPVEG